jgi:hypothetical protein
MKCTGKKRRCGGCVDIAIFVKFIVSIYFVSENITLPPKFDVVGGVVTEGNLSTV